MLISEVIEAVKAYCKGTGPDGLPLDPDKTRVRVLYGEVDRECTGIVTCIWASMDVIREAAARGANLIISHEALFWNHGDHTSWMRAQRNAAFLAKTALLDKHGITVWRCHDYIHSGIPSPVDGSCVDGIFWGLVDLLGWQPKSVEPLADQAVLLSASLDGRTAVQLGRDVAAALGTRGVRLIGDPETPVHRVGVAMHMSPSLDNAMITAMEEGIDCMLAMETNDYTLLQYVRDSSQADVPKAVLSCGHFNIEDPGMAYMLNWLPEALGTGELPMCHVAAGDPFQYVLV